MQEVLSMKIDDKMAELIGEIAKEEGTGKSPMARKLLELGLRQWRTEKAVSSVISGKASVWKASEMAGISLREFLEIPKRRRVSWVRIEPSHIEAEMKHIKGVK